MRNLLDLVTLFLICGSAVASPCEPQKDYAQYKDESKTEMGRYLMADQYCLFGQLGELQQTRAAREACETEQSKMLTALNSARDPKIAAWALRGCPANDPITRKFHR